MYYTKFALSFLVDQPQWQYDKWWYTMVVYLFERALFAMEVEFFVPFVFSYVFVVQG